MVSASMSSVLARTRFGVERDEKQELLGTEVPEELGVQPGNELRRSGEPPWKTVFAESVWRLKS